MTERRKRIIEATRLVWDSLDSHLDHAVEERETPCKSCGSRKFHAKCVREYAFIIEVLCEQL